MTGGELAGLSAATSDRAYRRHDKIIDAVRRPSAIFYMPSPPVQAALPTTFRQAVGSKHKRVSPPALREVRKARRIQRVVRWLIDEGDNATAVSLAKFDWRSTSPVSAGVQMRESIDLSLYEQGEWQDFSAALREWRNIFDELGVLVFSLQLGKDEITRDLGAISPGAMQLVNAGLAAALGL